MKPVLDLLKKAPQFWIESHSFNVPHTHRNRNFSIPILQSNMFPPVIYTYVFSSYIRFIYSTYMACLYYKLWCGDGDDQYGTVHTRTCHLLRHCFTFYVRLIEIHQFSKMTRIISSRWRQHTHTHTHITRIYNVHFQQIRKDIDCVLVQFSKSESTKMHSANHLRTHEMFPKCNQIKCYLFYSETYQNNA